MMRASKVRLAIGAMGASVLVSSCTSCHRQTATLHTDLTVPISDPWLKKLVAITDRIILKASGVLRPGRYQIDGKTIKVVGGTRFEIDVLAAFDGNPVIMSDRVEGFVTLEPPVEINGVPAPNRISLKQGEATVEMDFGRAIFALIVSGLQKHPKGGGTANDLAVLESLPAKVSVAEARLELKPGTQLELTGLSARVGERSFIAIRDVAYSSLSSYRGKLEMELKLKDGTRLQWGNVKADIKSGELMLNADLEANGGNISASSIGADKKCRLTVEQCSMRLADGQNSKKDSSEAEPTHSLKAEAAKIEVSLSKVGIAKLADSASPPDLNLSGSAAFVDAGLSIKSKSEEIALVCPEKTAAYITAQLKSSGRQDIGLKIDDGLKARNFHWRSQRGDNQFGVELEEVSINQLRANSAQGLTMLLDALAVKPTSLSWKSKTATIDISCDQQSKVVSTGPLGFSFDGNAFFIPSTVPFNLSAGSVRIRDRHNNLFQLKNVIGDCKVGTSSDDIHLDSTLKMKVATNTDIFGIHGWRGEIGKLTISGSSKHTRVQLFGGRVVIAQSELRKAVMENLPDPAVVNVNETLLDKKKWRYRNFRLKKIVVRNPHLERLELNKTNEIAVAGEADLKLLGSVEVYHQKLNPLSRTPSKWREHEWKADARVNEDGVVDYKLIPGKTVADSKIHLDTAIAVSYPQKLNIDWSAVAGDSLARAENQILQMALTTAKALGENKSKLVKYSGDLPLVRSSDRRLRSIRMTSFNVVPSGKEIVINFDGQIDI